MKYNPKAYDVLSALPAFASAHLFAPESAVQGTLEMMYNLQELLKEITGLASFTLQPAAGARGINRHYDCPRLPRCPQRF